MRPNPTLPPLLFLDFDGVLHPNGCPLADRFNRASLLAELLDQHLELDIVISSSWRFHHTWDELLKALPEGIATKAIACTGGPLPGQFQRHREIIDYVTHSGNGRPWRAIDDACWEFPIKCAELIPCDGATGILGEQMLDLEEWLACLDSCRRAVSLNLPVSRLDLIGAADELLAAAETPCVALLQRALRVGHTEGLALLGHVLKLRQAIDDAAKPTP